MPQWLVLLLDLVLPVVLLVNWSSAHCSGFGIAAAHGASNRLVRAIEAAMHARDGERRARELAWFDAYRHGRGKPDLAPTSGTKPQRSTTGIAPDRPCSATRSWSRGGTKTRAGQSSTRCSTRGILTGYGERPADWPRSDARNHVPGHELGRQDRAGQPLQHRT